MNAVIHAIIIIKNSKQRGSARLAAPALLRVLCDTGTVLVLCGTIFCDALIPTFLPARVSLSPTRVGSITTKKSLVCIVISFAP